MNKEIKNFIEQSLQEIVASLPNGYQLQDAVTFDLLFTVKKKKSGKLKFSLVDNKTKEDALLHRVSFTIQHPQRQLTQIQNTADAIMEYVRKGLMEFKLATEGMGLPIEKKAIKAKTEVKSLEKKVSKPRKTTKTLLKANE